MREARLRRLHNIWYHFYNILEKTKSQEWIADQCFSENVNRKEDLLERSEMRKFWGGVKPFYRCLSKLVESEKSDFTNINTLQKWKIGLQRIKIKSWDLFEKDCDDQNKNRRLDPGTGDGDQGTDPTWVFKTELMSLAMAIGREWGRSIRQWELLDFGWISGWVLWTFTKTERGKVLEDKLMNAFRSYISETLIIRCLLSINMWISSPQMNSLNEDFFPSFSMYHIHINL